MNHLYVVDDDEVERTRLFVFRMEGEDFDGALANFPSHRVINADDEEQTDAYDPRETIRILVECEGLVLPDIWWTSPRAQQLVHIAGWCGIRLFDYRGNTIPTAGMKKKAKA